MTNHTPLDRHSRDGRILRAPFSTIPNFKLDSWFHNRLPDLMWAALIRTFYSRDSALQIFRVVSNIEIINEIGGVTHSFLEKCRPQDLDNFLKVLVNERSRNILRPILLFDQMKNFQVWASHINDRPIESDWDLLMQAVYENSSHQSQSATDLRWLKLICMMKIGKLRFPKHMIDDAHGIIFYPDHGDMRKIRPMIRSAEGAMEGVTASEEMSRWRKEFWKTCYEKTNCIAPAHADGDTVNSEVLSGIGIVRSHLTSILTLKIVMIEPDNPRLVTVGFLLYLLRLLDELFSCKESYILTNVAMRCLVDMCITLTYLINKSDDQLWVTFKNYGIGQFKLALLKNEGEAPITLPVGMERISLVVNEEKWLEFTDINIGSWANINSRQMAIEANMKEMYDKYFDLTSSFVHGNWAAIRTAAYENCLNPLHKFHLLPSLEKLNARRIFPEAVGIVNMLLDKAEIILGEIPLRINKAYFSAKQ